MKKIRAGVIGVGYLGRFHAQKYALLEDVDLVGVSDSNALQAEKVAQECKCTAYTNYQDMLPLVDAVSIVVPTSLHHEVARTCLNKGLDVLLEKPMTVTLAEADELIALSDEKKRVLQLGHLERFNPAILAAKPLLTEPMLIESHRIATFKNRGVDVDVVLDLMIHDIDIILNIVNAPLKSLSSAGIPVITETTDIATTRLLFENGAIANLTVSRVAPETRREMRIQQAGSSLEIDFAAPKITVTPFDKDIQPITEQPTGNVHLFSEADALKTEIEHFLDHVRKRTAPAVTGRQGRKALQIALEVMAQIKEHQNNEVFQKYTRSRCIQNK